MGPGGVLRISFLTISRVTEVLLAGWKSRGHRNESHDPGGVGTHLIEEGISESECSRIFRKVNVLRKKKKKKEELCKNEGDRKPDIPLQCLFLD